MSDSIALHNKTINQSKPKKEPFVPGPYQILWNTDRWVRTEQCIIFDIDGTVARKGDRSFYEWNKVNLDAPHDDVIEMSQILNKAGYDIVVVSGRDSTAGKLSFDWLNDHKVPFCALITRQAKDHRNDAIIKEEIYNECIKPRWKVKGVFDDRQRVVDKWRELGLRCYQVAPGDF